MWTKLFTLFSFITIALCEYKYETKWFEVPLDHFGFQRNETFKIKYLVNDDHWDKGGGPIFFYTGNEGQIELFAKHTGFIWDIASEYKAKIIFAEHRYYGASMPFDKKSLDNDHIGYLTSSQALADYADLIDFLQGSSSIPRYPVIAFGGSYGGMLAAYFRMKYPHLVNGAIAASAPIHMYQDMVPCDLFNRIATSSYKVLSNSCAENIAHSWSVIRNYTSSPNGTAWLKENWKLCDPITNTSDVEILMDFLESMYITLAMVDYPYPSDFLMPLPGQPIRVACQYLNTTLQGKSLLEGIGNVLNLFTNYENKNKCVNYRKGSDYGNLDAAGWDFQACTEMVMPMCSTGKDDMFEPSAWNKTQFAADCYKKYHVYPRWNAAKIEYGGSRLQAASNIVFSNGLWDPWAAGGIMYNLSDTVVAVIVIDGAHHLDLMASNPADSDSVKRTRIFHKENINKWINEFGLHSKNVKP